MTNRRFYTRFLPILLAITLVAAGCAGAPPQPSPPGETPVPPVVEVPPPVTSQTVALFFPDWQVQHALPEARQVPEATGAKLATQVVKELVAGPTDPHLNRPFPAGVKLLEDVTVEDGVARVNLSKEMRALQGSAGVGAAKMALALSLTEIEGIDQVTVLIEGQAEDLHGMAMGPFDRGLYLYRVFPDPERAKTLQERYGQGLEPWRADPVKVAQWEGRMFGFTSAELQSASVTKRGTAATVQVTRDGTIYTFTLIQNQAAQGDGIWTVEALDPLTRHTLSGLSAQVRAWAELYTETTVGVSRRAGDRVYLLAAVEEGGVRIESAEAKDGQLVVTVVKEGAQKVAIASVSGADASLPVVFDSLPTVQNPHGLPEVTLHGNIVVLRPEENQTVTGSIAIKGYARHLFEANLVARLLDAQGKEVASAPTTAGACCFDWGSFDFVLKHTAPAGNYRLELGDYSPKDGAWESRIAIPVTVK